MDKHKVKFIQRMTILFLMALTLLVFSGTVNAATYYVATNGSGTAPYDTWEKASTTIQAAVDAASDGDTIMVGSYSDGGDHGTGAYTENVDVDKKLTIQSESGYDYTEVVAADPDTHVFSVTADNVTINGFTIYGATGSDQAGIYLYDVEGCTIENNRCGFNDSYRNYYGIYLILSSNNMLNNNTASYNIDSGITIGLSTGNNLSGNTANYNREGRGIYLGMSSNNTLNDNTADYNFTSGIKLEGAPDMSCSGNTLISNYTIHNNIGIYCVYCSNNTIISNDTSSNDGGNNSNTKTGIMLSYSSNNTISNNTANSNPGGAIYLYDNSSYNTIVGNTCAQNDNHGIHLDASSTNDIYLNNLISNSPSNVYSEDGSTNTWNSPTTIYYDYDSETFYKGYLGNYYSDGNHTGNYGIGGTYTIADDNNDDYQLTNTSDSYSLQAWWLNSDGNMYRDDPAKSGGEVTINNGGVHIWKADRAASANINFSASDVWTGQLVFTSAPTGGHTFTLEIGVHTRFLTTDSVLNQASYRFFPYQLACRVL